METVTDDLLAVPERTVGPASMFEVALAHDDFRIATRIAERQSISLAEWTARLVTDEIARQRSQLRRLEAVFGEQAASEAATEANCDEARKLSRLSSRERDVLQRICAGKPLMRIGEELHLNSKTISTYRARILQKLKIKSNVDLIQFALTCKRKNLLP